MGASYGGYMMNWIAGNWSDGFRCIVNHAGIFDGRGMYYQTEELWFEEWEHGGAQFEKPENYEKFNPVNHVAAVANPDAGDSWPAGFSRALRTESVRVHGAAAARHREPPLDLPG